ncbi:MAG: sigma-70 family RNA polymerase sigma factor [Chloroflexota bacterium]
MPKLVPSSPDDTYVAPPTMRVGEADAVVVAAYEAYHQELFGFLQRTVRDEAAAQDLLQETFLRLMGEVRSGRAPENSRAWLYRVASNLAISRGRRRATVVRWLTRYGVPEHQAAVEESPEAGAVRHEASDDLESALAQISADARAALILSGQGFSGAEIAQAIGRTGPATRTLMCRARLRLRDILATQEAVR